MIVSVTSGKFYEISQYQKTNNFEEKYKKRALIEGKNAELKRFHGLYQRAKGYGLFSVSMQSKLAAIAVNIKTIVDIVTTKPYQIYNYIISIIQIKVIYYGEIK